MKLCAHCRLRPVKQTRSTYCSRACVNRSRKRPLADRFLDFYRPGKPDACWLWTGTIHHTGYGLITDDARVQQRAHRVAFERLHGPIPEGRCVMHSCDNPSCVNPAHLSLGTFADNNEDKRHKKRHSYGSHHGRAKITEADVRDIRAMYPRMSQTAIAKQYGLNQTIVSDIVRRVLWKHVP